VAKIFNAMDGFLGVVGFVTLGWAPSESSISCWCRSPSAPRDRPAQSPGRYLSQHSHAILVEGAFLTLFSGGIGMGLAAGFMALLGMLPQPDGFDTPHIVLGSAAAAILSLTIAGVVAGVYPARKAALLEPVEALRQE